MTEQLKNKLSDSKTLRWSVLALVAFTMLCGYFLTDVMFTTIRASRGEDIFAACGMLSTAKQEESNKN